METADYVEPGPAAGWLAGGGEMGRLIRATDWGATALGPVGEWPQSLRSAVSILLPSKAQICLFWGRDLITIYNDAYAPVLGLKHPGALGRPVREVWSELWDVIGPLFEGVLDTGEAFWAQAHPFNMQRHGFTEETFFDISYDPIRDESGGVGGLFCIVSDMTGRVVGERRLGLLRDLGRAASDARSVKEVFEHAARVFERNPRDIAFAVMLDASGARVAGTRFERAAPWPVERLRGAPELVLGGAELSGAGPLPGGDWPEPCRSVVMLAIGAPGQPPVGFLAVGTSPRRPLDDAYRDFLRLVASSIAAAVAAARALEEQRAQAQALAELDRAKTAFFSNVSHEFRTPLTLLLGPLEALIGEPGSKTETDRELLETAHRNGLRMLKLVNTLLDFSRIEAGRMEAQFAPVDLARFTAELASNFRSACEKAGLRLVVDCPRTRERVYVDPGMWEKIVLNLLSNAFKFTFHGEIAVTLAETGDGVEMTVRDTGIGMAPAEIPRLFERFYRVEGARGRSHEGSGIGLALVQELVRMHGGEIRVRSEPGRGSTFTVRLRYGTDHLPTARVAGGDAAPAAPAAAGAFVEEALGWLRPGEAAARDATPVARDEARVLVVDDNADMRRYVARLLDERWHAATAADGQQALDMLGAQPFDVVVADVMMPRVDGFELLRSIRSRPETLDVSVILVSARAGEEARIEGIAAGADDYIVKPFSARDLVARVSAQIGSRRARHAAAAERERLLAREQAAKREAELQREHLHSLFMQAPNPIVILHGPDHVIRLANPHACAVWGRAHHEVIGRPLFAALPDVRGQGFEQLLDGVLRTGVAYEGKEVCATFERGGGARETFYFNFVYTPLRGLDGAVEGILVTAFNVTDEVIAREQMSGLRAAAERASRAKDEFLAMLGHELRNPLAPIVTAVQLLRVRGVAAPEIAILERQSGHLARLVDDLLDVSRISQGKIELRRTTVELAEAVLRAVELCAPLLEQRSQRVDSAAVPRAGLPVDADVERLAQVIANLVSNASKYSDPGSTITLRGGSDGGWVRLEVADRGLGIAPDMVERIFEAFVQQPQMLARSAGGLGLGLTIVRSLVDMHGGKVHARSAGPGKGSEFIVELPAARGIVRKPASLASPRPAAGVPRSRILVVDDNNDAASSLADLLRFTGHSVAVAGDASHALQAAREFRPQLALIDIGLPGMDGYQLAARLREERNGAPPLHLVALTGYGLVEDRERALQAGFDEHFVKPLDLGRLEALIGALARRGAGRPDEAQQPSAGAP